MKKRASRFLCFLIMFIMLISQPTAVLASSDNSRKQTIGSSIGDSLPKTLVPSNNYVELAVGSNGEAVKALQARLAELGYYDNRIDGDFGNQTQTALNAFLLQNGFEQTGVASPMILEYLFSDDALAAPPKPDIEVEKVSLSNNRLSFSVKNNTGKTITKIVYEFILINSDGNAYLRYDFDTTWSMYQNNTLDDVSMYGWVANTTIKPGATKSISEPRYLYYNLNADELAIGICAYTTSDGTSVELSEYEVAYLTTKGRQIWAYDRFEKTTPLSKSDYEKATKIKWGFDHIDVLYYLTAWAGLPEGYYLTDITEGSLVDIAGLQKGDVITTVDNEPIINKHAIEKAKLRMLDGEDVELQYWRNNQMHTAYLSLDEERTKALNMSETSELNENSTTSIADELLKLAELLEKGLITQEEYNTLKEALLNK